MNVLDHDTGIVMVADYVGKTRQRLSSRARQHRDDKPWEDLIVGDFYILEQGMWTDEELDEAEQRLIRERRPRLNYEFNLDNPNRIPIYTQQDQRHDRDDRMGRPHWVHPDERVAVPTTADPGPVEVVEPVGLWKPWQIAAGAWLAVWVALSSLVWVLLGLALHSDAEVWASVVAVVAGSLGTAEVARRWYRRSRQPRRRRASRR